jgi:hypothetical protein
MTTWETNVTEVVWESQTAPGITWTTVVGGTSSGGGVTVHNDLSGRSAADAHPMSAITDLEPALTDIATAVQAQQGDIGTLQTAVAELLAADADLTAIAALAPSDDALIQRKAGAWTSRTPAQVKADMSIGVGDVSGLDENTRDVIGTALVAGSGVAVTVDDPGNTITIAMADAATVIAPPSFRLIGNAQRDMCIPGEFPIMGVSLLTPTANRVIFERYILRAPQTFDQVGIEITSAAAGGSLLRLALYTLDANGQAANRVADFGTVDAASATAQYITLGAPLTLQPGLYVGVWVTNGSNIVRTVSGPSLFSNAINPAAGATPVRNPASFLGFGLAAGGFPAVANVANLVAMERDLFNAGANANYAMRFRQVA